MKLVLVPSVFSKTQLELSSAYLKWGSSGIPLRMLAGVSAMGNRFLSLMLLATLLSSCNSTSTSTPAENVDVIGAKKSGHRASCDYAFDEGEAAPLELPEQRIKASLFLKKYDANLIESVRNTSGAETARFASLTGVTFYQVPDLDIDDSDCLFTETLPAAPKVVLDYFRDAENSVKQEGDGKSSLLGFYLDKERVEEISGSGAIGPVVTVKNDSERYTMVHEFFHHIFSLEKEVSGTQLQINLGKSSGDFSNSITAYNNAANMENLEIMARNFDVQSKDVVKVLKEYTLEEMAIEYELNDLYERKKLHYVNYYSRLNGDFYTVSSAENAVSRIQKNEKMLDTIDMQAKALPGDNQKVLALTAVTRKMLVDLKNEINVFARFAQKRIDAYKNTNNFVSINKAFSIKKHKTHECEHGHGVDMLLDKVESGMAKIQLKK